MITSMNNEHIKELVKLKQSKYRNLTKCFLVEGFHLVEEAKENNCLIEVLTTDEKIAGTHISEVVLRKLASTVNPEKVIGVCKMPIVNIETNKILFLDGVSDPNNLGSLLRSAKAFGFDTIFASVGTVDYYNDKVLRGSQGAIFKLNLLSGNGIDYINRLKKTHLIVGTNVRNGTEVENFKNDDKVVLILGNEARGISKEIAALVDKNYYIPMKNMESLNVSIAGSILMYEMTK